MPTGAVTSGRLTKSRSGGPEIGRGGPAPPRIVAAAMQLGADSHGRGRARPASTLLRWVIAGAWVPFVTVEPALGYRFMVEAHESSLIPTRADALEWSRAIWRPGGALVWWLADDPDWSATFGDPGDAMEVVEQGLEAWTAISTADIRWRLEGVTSSPGKGRDGRNTVSVEDDNDAHGTGAVSYVRIWHEWAPGRRHWETVECDVVLSSWTAEHLDEIPAHKFLIHEFGHCLGLRHGAITPTPRWSSRSWTDSSVWSQDPAMSYGVHRDRMVPPDDALGASLLRPAPGWLRTTGSIAGTVQMNDEPARFVSISALRLEGGGLREVGAVFANEDGRFVLEGLEPGDYVLWIHPLLAHHAHKRLMARGAVTRFSDFVIPQPVRVTAGQETEVAELSLRPGRAPPPAGLGPADGAPW